MLNNVTPFHAKFILNGIHCKNPSPNTTTSKLFLCTKKKRKKERKSAAQTSQNTSVQFPTISQAQNEFLMGINIHTLALWTLLFKNKDCWDRINHCAHEISSSSIKQDANQFSGPNYGKMYDQHLCGLMDHIMIQNFQTGVKINVCVLSPVHKIMLRNPKARMEHMTDDYIFKCNR